MDFNFEKLEVYKKSINCIKAIYNVTQTFPKDEMLCLTNQIRRASVSIALNIAEGSSRSSKDFKRFLDIAKGSIYECAAVLEIACEQKYIEQNQYRALKEQLIELSKMTSGLKKALSTEN